ncbi:MAG TPA: radical SAM protein [Gemmatimonadaceae bacterium]|nr:radical SAM protein [Gemmatimonadaceae bacterium]
MQQTIFTPDHTPGGFPPLVGEQKDIRYFGTDPRSLLNSPATTGMSFWSINPYVGCAFGCAYCYARYAHRYAAERLADSVVSADGARDELADMPSWLAFERRIFVKREAGAVLRRELRRPSKYRALQRETVVIGTATDPYQPAERRFRITRGVLETLAEQQGLSVTIITKSPLVTRDVDLLLRIAARSRLSVHVSLITADRELARRLEPRAPTPEARLRAIARLRANGIEVGVNVMPVLPGITDSPLLLESLVRSVAEANASYLGACALRLQSAARQRYLPFIESEFPHLAARYRSTYARSHQAGQRYRDGLREHFRALCAAHGVVFDRYYKSDEDDEESEAVLSRDAALQLALAL